MTDMSKNQQAKLSTIVKATHGNPPYAFFTQKNVKVLLDAGYVECNTDISDGDRVAVRATKTGEEALQRANNPPNESESTMSTETPQFAIDNDVSIPAVTRRGATASPYPFDEMELGQSFFVPATEAMANPGKSLASTVSSASKRYATENGTRLINRRNKETNEMGQVEVPKYHYERKFMVRTVEENGVKGARVWRIEPKNDE